ncbi:hypothetical protein EDB85DRAFT_2214673 [Lactarius pseudohatsudake]|nr:hypothetical protein EDB85DRAFT_2214673 [Lactarius pseudohatsudake]
MLPLTMLRTLNGPIPNLFTRDLAHAAQFIQDLDNLVWKNCNHPLISTPWTRIDLALAFISGPTTLAWRRSIRCSRTTEVTTDTLWDDFLELFCETWVHSPESTVSIVAPAVQISTANVPSPSLAEASTLKRVEDISIILATDELSPRCLLETIDLTADDDEADDWSLFAPRVPAPPPRNPRCPFSPRLASPVASILDSVKPVNERPPPPRSTYCSASPIVPVTTRDSSSDPPLPLIETPDLSTTASAAQRAEERPVAIPVDVDHVQVPSNPNLINCHGAPLFPSCCRSGPDSGFPAPLALHWSRRPPRGMKCRAVKSETTTLGLPGRVIEGDRGRLRTLLRGLRPRMSAARSGEATQNLLGQVVEGRRKRLRTLLRGAQLHICNCLYWEHVGFKLIRPRESAARLGGATQSLLGQVVKGRRKRLCTLLRGTQLRLTKAVRGCGDVGRDYTEPAGSGHQGSSEMVAHASAQRKTSHMCRPVFEARRVQAVKAARDRLCRKRVGFGLLRPRASAVCWGTQGAGAGVTEEERDNCIARFTSPHASNGTTRKRKHKTNEEDDTRPGKRIHAQLARRSIPLPRKYRYVQRRPTVPPPPVNDSSGRPALNVASLLPLSSPDDDKPITVSVAVVSPLQRLRTVSPDPSPSTALSALTCVPSLPFPPTPRCVSPSSVRTPSPVALLALSPILDGFPHPSSPAVFALPVDDIDDAAKAFLFPSRLPSPFLAPAPSSALPPTSIVEDNNSLRRGVKTLGASVFAPDFVVSPVTTSPTNNLDSSIEAPDSPPQHQNQRKFATPTTNDDYRALFAPRHPVTPATVPVSPSADHVNNKRTPHNDAPVQPRSPRHPHIFPPNPCKRPRDLDKPTAESTHAQPQQARSCQAPRPIDRRIKDEQPPDALAKRRAVDTFLKNYDVNKTVQKPTPAEDDREYDAVAQHLDRWLQMTDRQYRSHPFCLHHAKIQHAMIEPRQSTNAKMNKTELPRHSQQPRSHSPGHIRKARIRHALTHEERQRYHTENFDSG